MDNKLNFKSPLKIYAKSLTKNLVQSQEYQNEQPLIREKK